VNDYIFFFTSYFIYIVAYRSVISSISPISDLAFEFSDLIRAEYSGRVPCGKEISNVKFLRGVGII